MEKRERETVGHVYVRAYDLFEERRIKTVWLHKSKSTCWKSTHQQWN